MIDPACGSGARSTDFVRSLDWGAHGVRLDVVAPAALFLASEGARCITGAVVAVDGGASASTGQPHL